MGRHTHLAQLVDFTHVLMELGDTWMQTGTKLIHPEDDRIYITKGKGRNSGRSYLHFEKITLYDDDGRQKKLDVTLCDDGNRKIKDYGITAEQRKREELSRWLSLPKEVRNYVDTHFILLSLASKICLAEYLLDGRETLGVLAVIGNGTGRNGILEITGELPGTVTIREVAEKVRAHYQTQQKNKILV